MLQGAWPAAGDEACLLSPGGGEALYVGGDSSGGCGLRVWSGLEGRGLWIQGVARPGIAWVWLLDLRVMCTCGHAPCGCEVLGGGGARCMGVTEAGVVRLRGRGLRLGVAKGCSHGLAHVPGNRRCRCGRWAWPVELGVVWRWVGVVRGDVGVLMS